MKKHMTQAGLPASAGFSLTELMVALTIGLFLTSVVLLIFLGNKQSYNVQDQSARIQENGRYAMEALMKDVRLAGFWGGNADKSVKLGDYSVVTASTSCNATSWSRKAAQPIYGLNDTNNDGTTVGNYTTCIPNANYAGGDILAVRRASTTPIAAGGLVANGNYVVTDFDVAGLFTGTTPPVTVAVSVSSANPLGTPQSIYQVAAHAYYVRNGNSSCPTGPNAGQAVPSLYRLVASDAVTLTSEEIIAGVQDFQVQYSVDTSAAKNLSEIRYFDAHPTNVDWNNVVAVRVWLLLRALCPEQGLQDTTVYQIPGPNPGPFNDAFRRKLFTATIMLRNKK